MYPTEKIKTAVIDKSDMDDYTYDAVDIKRLKPGQSILILDTDNYKTSYSCSEYPCEGIVDRVTDYPCIWVKAEGKEFELYEWQVGLNKDSTDDTTKSDIPLQEEQLGGQPASS